jgi:alpha-tubulin suppressor-like RCC1 family protein
LGDVTDFAVGFHHVCALNQSGQVFCWGENSMGQIGARKAEARVDTPVRVDGIDGAKAITCGTLHSCAILGDGRVSCWGWNGQGQTGSDVEYTTEARELVVPEIVPGIAEATSIVAGRAHTCAKTKAGLLCWGESQLKSQRDTRGHARNQPSLVEDLVDVEQLAAKDETSCALFRDKHVGCWGSGAFSVMPSRPLRAESPLPVILPPARSVAISQYHGCAILENGRVSCFGWNNHGELGRERQSDYQPHESDLVPGLPGTVDALAVGAATSCAIVRHDELWCWGIPPQMPWVHDAGSGVPVRVPIDP